MSAKVYLAGLAGGLLVSAALIYPCYYWVPYLYLADWPFGGDIPATLLAALALVLFAATGAAAARLSGLETRTQAAGAGAVAGLMAAMLSFGWMVRPAVGVFGASELLMHGAVPAADNTAYIELLLGAVLGVSWWTSVAYAAWLPTGVLLAALGGLAAGPRGMPDKHWKIYGLAIALTGMLIFGLMLIVDVTTMSILVSVTQDAALENGTTLAHPVDALLVFPLAVDWLFLVFWQLVAWRTLRNLAAGAEARARLWTFAGYYSFLFPIVTFFWLSALEPTRWPLYLGGMSVATLAGLPALQISLSLHHLPVTDEFAFRGRRWVVFFAAVAALFTLSAFTPLAAISLNLVLLVVTMLQALLPDATSTPAAFDLVNMVHQNYLAGWSSTGWLILSADFAAAIYVTVIVFFVTVVLKRTRETLAKWRALPPAEEQTIEDK